METQQVVVLTEDGELELTSLSRHVLYHTVQSLLPSHSMQTVQLKSSSQKIEKFCNDLPKSIMIKSSKKKASTSESFLLDDDLMSHLDILKFLEQAITVAEFTLLLEHRLIDVSGGELDADKLHEICWGYYHAEKQSSITIRKWFSTTCTYRLWLVFCCVQEQVLEDTLSAMTANEVIKRLVELCGYTWNEAYRYSKSDGLEFSEYLQAIASYFKRLTLETSVTCEAIVDIVDELVHGVLKKGYLMKKGHKRKNWKKRWFVLQRAVIKYFESRENMNLKGELVLNSKTVVHSIPERGKHHYMFEVICGHTGTPLEICADDQKTKQEWILAVKKAIALAKVLDGSAKQDDLTEQLTGFYLLKYGTSQPSLERQDSTVRQMKYQAGLKEQRKRLSGRKKETSRFGEEEEDVFAQEEYVEMNPQSRESVHSSDSSLDSYTAMSPIQEELMKSSKSAKLTQEAPPEESSFEHERFSKSYHPALRGTQSLGPSTTDNPFLSDVCDDIEPNTPVYNFKSRKSDPQIGVYVQVGCINEEPAEELTTTGPLDYEGTKVGMVTAHRMISNSQVIHESPQTKDPPNTGNFTPVYKESSPQLLPPLPPPRSNSLSSMRIPLSARSQTARGSSNSHNTRRPIHYRPAANGKPHRTETLPPLPPH